MHRGDHHYILTVMLYGSGTVFPGLKECQVKEFPSYGPHIPFNHIETLIILK
jgi:hypothetical protein